MSPTQDTYDFIIVGGGPAGCALAASLAKSAKRPSVLLLEAGGRNDDPSLRVDGKRWTTFQMEDMNWGYKTVPQEHLNGRKLDYSRGKGLGGSTAINFGVYITGAQDDYDEWAAEVGDDTFRWENMQRRFKKLESFDTTVHVPEHEKYVKPKASDHGSQGALRLAFPREWEKDVPLVLDAYEQAGLERNLDHNSGNPLGMALMVNSSYQGQRITAADLLIGVPDNLLVLTESPVQRVILQDKKAVGVEVCGKQYLSAKEVILSAGSLDSPKILMHSGIGPAAQLQSFNIPVVQDLQAVGQGLKDHYFAPLIVARKPETNDRNAFYQDEAVMNAASELWQATHTGPWARYGCQLTGGWFKSDRITSSDEFKALPKSAQDFMNRKTIPHYEITSHLPIHLISPELFQDYSYVCFAVFMMNEQSSGEVHLQSSNPDDPLLFDPKFLEHPFDRQACIQIYRHLMDIAKHPAFAKDTVSTIVSPSSESDEDILEFWKNNLSSSWHMTGTVKMGKPGNAEAAVDSQFRVFGIEHLRVADMSVVPVLTNNHTQATAYVTGSTCADVLIQEYALDAL
ncbi:hypothetical protein N7510_005215 [Penicillium lagena]|uniref:uncharacterized protein n=1 Tax=Penicillium lagena TaxID=94218 RepID=UPI00253F8F50|nr:uncharacterized protein N7510_005215 [Penicillium lagena]KAJ5612021.1 hypothetical protein N7510_005215 [Penicillium lagena]